MSERKPDIEVNERELKSSVVVPLLLAGVAFMLIGLVLFSAGGGYTSWVVQFLSMAVLLLGLAVCIISFAGPSRKLIQGMVEKLALPKNSTLIGSVFGAYWGCSYRLCCSWWVWGCY